jgi:hypothetical protein
MSLPLTDVRAAVDRFVGWLSRNGETSYDHQSYFAGPIGRRAKALYYRRPLLGIAVVAPMIASEALVPSARRMFWKAQRFPIADAHYAMGFAFLARIAERPTHYERAVHFLEMLERTRCRGWQRHAWGYPFDWETRNGTIAAATPLITTLPYAYEAFREVYALDKDERWRAVMRSAAEHALLDYRDIEIAPGVATCTYTPSSTDPGGVINASAYRAAMLFTAGVDLADPRYAEPAECNLRFVLGAQNADGSWYYSIDGQRDFVDHFHTCFVLKALSKIEAIERGVAYYVRHLFDERRLPKPFSRAPRLTVYRRELYDYAECVNVATLLRGRSARLDSILAAVVVDLLARWRKPDGSFRARELFVGWDNVPMHRWAQSQLFRSLALLLRSAGE